MKKINTYESSLMFFSTIPRIDAPRETCESLPDLYYRHILSTSKLTDNDFCTLFHSEYLKMYFIITTQLKVLSAVSSMFALCIGRNPRGDGDLYPLLFTNAPTDFDFFKQCLLPHGSIIPPLFHINPCFWL